MEYVKVNGREIPAQIMGHLRDSEMDYRATKTIKAEMTYADAASTFVNGIEWSIISESEVDGETVREEYDNSDYCVAGAITDHRDGTISVKMAKKADGEETAELLAILLGEEA